MAPMRPFCTFRSGGVCFFSGRRWLDPTDAADSSTLRANYQSLCDRFPIFHTCPPDRFLNCIAEVSCTWSERLRASTAPFNCMSVAHYAPTWSSASNLARLSESTHPVDAAWTTLGREAAAHSFQAPNTNTETAAAETDIVDVQPPWKVRVLFPGRSCA